MPLTPEMRHSIDQIRDYLYGGGYPDPVTNAEQLSFLFFFYLVEGIDAENLLKAKVLKRPYESMFAGKWKIKNPLNAPAEGVTTIPRERFRWSVWARGLSGESLVRFVRDEIFGFFAEMGEKAAYNFMHGARLTIDEPTVLTQVVNLVDGLRLDQADADTKGDLFEHVLRQIKQAGELGQFRTPRHTIRAIVEMIDPKIGETIYDPAAGTAGFLVAAYNHIRLNNSSPGAIQEVEIDGKMQQRGLGDRLSSVQVSALQTATFFGNDVDPKMVRLATMNLTLRGLPNVRILLRNVLTTSMDAEKKAENGLPGEGYHIVLANPPFSGRVDKDRVVEDVKVGTSTATELLFLKYMMDSLRPGGRCGVIVPEGVLFGPTTAHKELRRQLVENNRVEAVLSLPGGIFQPYSGVKTSVLFFKKGGKTEQVQFLHADNDGYKLDANHDTPIEDDDLPELIATYKRKEECWAEWQKRDKAKEWTGKWWFADAATLRNNDFNLSAGRYRPINHMVVEHRNPRELLDELAAFEAEIVEEVLTLRRLLTEGAAEIGGSGTKWPEYELSKLASHFISGGTPSTKVAEYWNGDIPWITGADIIDGDVCLGRRYINEAAVKNSATNIVPKGSILMVTRTGVGKIAIAPVDIAISQDFTGIILKENVSPKFALAAIRSRMGFLLALQRGATIKGVTRNDVKSLSIPLPSFSEQQKIVDALSCAEGIARLQQEAQKKVSELIPALFLGTTS